jgi:hypothetical protein
VGDWLKWLYTDVTQKLEAKDFSTLQEVHACTAGLKAVTTSATAVCVINYFSCEFYVSLSGLLKLHSQQSKFCSDGLTICMFK